MTFVGNAQVPKTVSEVERDTDLPKALVKKIVKGKIAQTLAYNAAPGEAAPVKDIQINKDALLAFSESAKVFISYLTSAANDICKEAKRQTISAEDVFSALQDLDFGELLPPLKEALDAFRHETKEKSKRKAEQVKKRKAEEYERLHPQGSAPKQADLPADLAAQGPIAGQRFIQQQQQQQGAPFLAQGTLHPAFSGEGQKLPQPAAQFPQVGGGQGAPAAGYQPSAAAAAAAFGQGSNPFGSFSAQQASQFAAVLAQAQASQGLSQLLPQLGQQPQQQQQAGYALPASLQGQLGQASYAQFAAVVAQQAQRQREAQLQQQQAVSQGGLQALYQQQLAAQQQQQAQAQPVQAQPNQASGNAQLFQQQHLQQQLAQLQQQRILAQQAAAQLQVQQQQAAAGAGVAPTQQSAATPAVTEAAPTQGSGAGNSANPGAAYQ